MAFNRWLGVREKSEGTLWTTQEWQVWEREEDAVQGLRAEELQPAGPHS